MPPVVDVTRADAGAHSSTSEYRAELRRRRQREDVLFAAAKERIERSLERSERVLAEARAVFAKKKGGRR